MSLTWLIVIAALAAGTLAFRLAGPLIGSRCALPRQVERLLEIAATVLLAAVATTATFASAESTGDAFDVSRIVGIAVGCTLAWRRVPLAAVVIAAAGTTALLRWLVPL